MRLIFRNLFLSHSLFLSCSPQNELLVRTLLLSRFTLTSPVTYSTINQSKNIIRFYLSMLVSTHWTIYQQPIAEWVALLRCSRRRNKTITGEKTIWLNSVYTVYPFQSRVAERSTKNNKIIIKRFRSKMVRVESGLSSHEIPYNVLSKIK